jgi:hypothetical protein
MTVKEMMEVLSKMDPDKDVTVWNPEWDQSDPINEIEVDRDGDIVIY